MKPLEFVTYMKKEVKKNIPGIGHRIKSVQNPDVRVTLLKAFVFDNFKHHPYLDYALEVEKLTTSKKNNLILNVDGCIGIAFLDLLENCDFTNEEKEDIIAVIEEETDAFIHRDYERWANTYVQDETTIRLSAGSNGYNFVNGWDDLNSSFKEAFEDSPNLQVKAVKTNYKIKVYGNAAWVICDEKFLNIETGEDIGGTAGGCTNQGASARGGLASLGSLFQHARGDRASGRFPENALEKRRSHK